MRGVELTRRYTVSSGRLTLLNLSMATSIEGNTSPTTLKDSDQRRYDERRHDPHDNRQLNTEASRRHVMDRRRVIVQFLLHILVIRHRRFFLFRSFGACQPP